MKQIIFILAFGLSSGLMRSSDNQPIERSLQSVSIDQEVNEEFSPSGTALGSTDTDHESAAPSSSSLQRDETSQGNETSQGETVLSESAGTDIVPLVISANKARLIAQLALAHLRPANKDAFNYLVHLTESDAPEIMDQLISFIKAYTRKTDVDIKDIQESVVAFREQNSPRQQYFSHKEGVIYALASVPVGLGMYIIYDLIKNRGFSWK